jgi:predicted dehydrogenase
MVLRAAVVGGGGVSRVHLSGLDKSPLVDLVAVCDVDGSRAHTLAEQHDIDAYLDAETMLDRAALDWVHVCTPVQTHRDLSIAAIEAGVPVLIEKPVTTTAAEFEEIRAAATDHEVPVSVVRNHLFSVSAVEVRDRLAAGELGTLRGVDVVYVGNTRPDEENRGSWAFELPGGEFDEGISHPIYLALGVGGNPRSEADVAATTACHGRYSQGFTYDGLQLQWVTEEEVLCSVKALAGSVPQRLLLVHGEEKSLAVDLVSQTVVELEGDYKASPLARARSNLDHVRGRVRGTLENTYAVLKRALDSDWETEKRWNPHYYQFDLEARVLLEGGRPPVSLEHVWWTQTLVDRVREAAEPEAAAVSTVATPDGDR